MLRQNLNRFGIAIVPLLGLLLFGMAGCGVTPAVSSPRASVTPSPNVTTPAPQTRQAVVVDARVVPVRSVELNFPIGGLSVAAVLVEEGATVTKGEPLARLDTGDLDLEVERVRAALIQGQAGYNRLIEGATASEISQARAALAQAQAQLRQARDSVNPTDVAAAQARLDMARTRRAVLEAGPKQTDVQVATANRDQARTRLSERRNTLSAAKEQARRLIEEAANQLRTAQQVYSTAYWDYQQIAKGRPSNDPQVQARASDLEQRRLEVANAESALQRAQVGYEVAQKNEISGIADAEDSVHAAQARLDELLAGATSDVLAGVRSEEADAAARLDQLNREMRSGAIEQAAAGVAAAQVRLDELLAGPRQTDLDLTAASVEQLKLRVRQAEHNSEKATLVAPMNGVVVAVNVAPGEIPRTDRPAIQMADTSAWQLEASELTDLNVVKVAPGAAATISFDALPDIVLTGRVSRISPLGKNSTGETLYTVYITPDTWDARLRWNMIARVGIIIPE